MNKRFAIVALLAGSLAVSCTKDLNRSPEAALTSETLYTSEAGYRSSLAKIYAGLALTGNAGPAGSGDLGGIDEGFSSYIRNYWNLQELPTDEAVIAWNDATIKDFHSLTWTAADAFNRALYSRIFYQITLANAFIRESAEDKLGTRNITGADADKVAMYREEARLLRALSYLHALDLYRNPTFVTENDPIGSFFPPQTTGPELFNYIEEELLDIENKLADPQQNEYGRVDKASAWMILANLYLNAEVYTGQDRYDDAIIYSSKVINGPYTLDDEYDHLFLADNHTSPEIIFAVPFDGFKTQTFGGTTYLVKASIGGDMQLPEFGVNEGWGGLTTTKGLVQKFQDPSGATDSRAQFHVSGRNLEIPVVSTDATQNGYGVRKWKNITSAGTPGSNTLYPDTDFPVFRLAEAYLIYVEAVIRGGDGGSLAQAADYINELRIRAYGNNSGNISQSDLSLDFILDERARELHWEGKRRTDLIRFNKFTTNNYLWPWKGGVATGTAVGAHRNIYPIPSAEINTNPNLDQNPGY